MARWWVTASVVLGCVAISIVAAAGATAAAAPLTFTWPTSVAAEPDGSLLVVENGLHRLVRVDPSTGHVAVVAAGLPKPYAVARTGSGTVFLSDGGTLKRIDGKRAPRTVARVAEDIGPIAIAPGGRLYFATGTRVYRLGHAAPIAGAGAATPASFSAPHGIAVAADGGVLVSDTGNNRVRRIDPRSGVTTTFATVGSPRGIDVASDGTIYVVDATARRVAHLGETGKRLGFVGPRFGDPYALDATPRGVYVVDTSAAGVIRLVRNDGKVSTIPTG
jgi:serine/threonine-protein kinase